MGDSVVLIHGSACVSPNDLDLFADNFDYGIQPDNDRLHASDPSASD